MTGDRDSAWRDEPIVVTEVRVDDLRLGASPRQLGIDSDHVATLLENFDVLPPILVAHGSLQVLDGFHRVAAARRLGREILHAEMFSGSDAEAFAESVRRNVAHGRPLTLADRRAAASHILLLCPEWSDRRVGVACGLSPVTVSLLRTARMPTSSVEMVRVGRDGRSRPVDIDAQRDKIARALRDHPAASLRRIAKSTGASPSTVRRVRARPRIGSTSKSTMRAAAGAAAWQSDEALESSDEGRAFTEWFITTNVAAKDCGRHLEAMPLSRIFEVVNEARRRAAEWTDFADQLEQRARRESHRGSS